MRHTQTEAPVTEEILTATLVVQVLGWKVAPDRFIKSGRKWMPRWRFAPFSRLEDAFQLLDQAASQYRLEGTQEGFNAEVRVGERTGRASGEQKARTITLAVARGIGLEV